jgi:hypothetical protein
MLFFRFPESEQQAEAAAKQAEEIEAIVARAASFLANSPTPESLVTKATQTAPTGDVAEGEARERLETRGRDAAREIANQRAAIKAFALFYGSTLKRAFMFFPRRSLPRRNLMAALGAVAYIRSFRRGELLKFTGGCMAQITKNQRREGASFPE